MIDIKVKIERDIDQMAVPTDNKWMDKTITTITDKDGEVIFEGHVMDYRSTENILLDLLLEFGYNVVIEEELV